MPTRSVYLAKHRLSKGQRAHFAIFIPNAAHDTRDLDQDIQAAPPTGTVINVVGEPVMAGYVLEIKRNCDYTGAMDLEGLVLLGLVDESSIYDPDSAEAVVDAIPKGRLEREATSIAPPLRGQDVRAPVDGVKTRRCQEWTMEFLQKLVEKALIGAEAVGVVQNERDPPAHGIFGIR